MIRRNARQCVTCRYQQFEIMYTKKILTATDTTVLPSSILATCCALRCPCCQRYRAGRAPAPADLNLRSSPWIKRQVYNNGNPYRNADPLPRFISFKERLLTGWGFLSGLSLFRSRTQRRGTWSHTGSGTHTATAQRIAFAFRSSLPLKLSLLEGFGLEDSGKA